MAETSGQDHRLGSGGGGDIVTSSKNWLQTLFSKGGKHQRRQEIGKTGRRKRCEANVRNGPTKKEKKNPTSLQLGRKNPGGNRIVGDAVQGRRSFSSLQRGKFLPKEGNRPVSSFLSWNGELN